MRLLIPKRGIKIAIDRDDRQIVSNLHPLTVFIADDHKLFVDALVMALSQQTYLPVKILGTMSNGEQLLKKLHEVVPDLVLLDLNMPIMNGLEVIPILRSEYPDLKILVVTKYSDPKFVKECIQTNGISGYMLKTSSFDELLEGMYHVQSGEFYTSRELQLYPKDGYDEAEKSKFEETFLAKYNLTRRELEILGLIAQAKSNAEIADGLFISPQTVGAHRKNIMRKLNISTTAGLVRFAIENQLG